ncbi:MAG TPA: LysR family transcriptional regulator [Solirubrobacter sp.]|nr:LysR family transcriptional regulator [Solirubrobacter sp.]
MLDVRRLRLLSELARRGTIAEVARSVGYSPSAVSQSLARLEREAGMALLERDGRNVRLTPAARRLVERTDRVLAELDAAEAELAAEHGTVRGAIVIGAFPSAAARLVAPAVGVLHARHAELTCAIREHEPEDGIGLLRAGELDLLVSEHYDDVEPAPAGGLEQHLLVAEPLLLVLPVTAPGGDVVPLATLAAEPWIGGIGETQFAGALEHACRAAGFSPRFVHRADEASLYQALVAAGLGVGLLPALACTPFAGVRYARAAPEPPRRHIVALLRRGAARRPALAALLDALGEAARAAAPGEAARAAAADGRPGQTARVPSLHTAATSGTPGR